MVSSPSSKLCPKRLGEFYFLFGLCLWSWTIPSLHPICLSVLIINHQESPTWGEGQVPSHEGEWGTDFQNDLELIFLDPKLSATSCLSRPDILGPQPFLLPAGTKCCS